MKVKKTTQELKTHNKTTNPSRSSMDTESLQDPVSISKIISVASDREKEGNT